MKSAICKGLGVAMLLLALALTLVLAGCGSDDCGDTDGDGLTDCEEVSIYGTSPQLADTDGDSLSDYDEIFEFGFDADTNNFKFNPLIADVPKIEINIISPPDIEIIYTDSTTTSVERSTNSSTTVGTEQTNTTSTTVEESVSV